MIQVLGIGENVELRLREKLSISQKHIKEKLMKVLKICEEAVILSTCNRTEIYFNSERLDDALILELFNALDWDISIREYIFHLKEREAVDYLLKVTCGFHSKILGEEQILGQIKDALETAIDSRAAGKTLRRLFQTAITCGKELRHKSELYRVPVSSSSIAVKMAREKGIRDFMILGFGEVGELVLKYILSGAHNNIYLAVRNVDSINMDDNSVKLVPFSDRGRYYKEVDCIISCTSAPHSVIRRGDLPDKNFLIFDLAVPRDVHEDVYTDDKIELYDIDKIGIIDGENRIIRKKIMLENIHILEKHAEEFTAWMETRKISGCIEKLKEYGDSVYSQRYHTFKRKKNTKDNDELVELLLKSSSSAFVNRAIEVLKEEKMKGSAEECIRIIERMFCPQN